MRSVKSGMSDPTEDYGLVSQGEADRCGKMAIRVRKEIEEWIRKNHGDKIV